MNYLAHCYLSCSDEDLMIGNIITDFMRKREESNYSGQVLVGIQLHRSIDSFTDKHPASLRLREILRKRHDKYAPVVVDLIWDRMLCLNWSHYSGSDLKKFVQPIYKTLLQRRGELPQKFETKLDGMIKSDFLLAYSSKESMRKALHWMDDRVKFPSNFVGAIDDLEENQSEISELFKSFFPDVIAHVDTVCDC